MDGDSRELCIVVLMHAEEEEHHLVELLVLWHI